MSGTPRGSGDPARRGRSRDASPTRARRTRNDADDTQDDAGRRTTGSSGTTRGSTGRSGVRGARDDGDGPAARGATGRSRSRDGADQGGTRNSTGRSASRRTRGDADGAAERGVRTSRARDDSNGGGVRGSTGRVGSRGDADEDGARGATSRTSRGTGRRAADEHGSSSVRGAAVRARTKAGAAAARRAERARGTTTRDSSRTIRDSSRPPAARRSRSETTPRADTGALTRGRYLARRWVAVLVVLSVVAVAYLVMFTSLLGVRSVEVIGTKDVPRADVLEAAAIEEGTPMVRLDADEAAARVAELPRVFEVVVERSWPSTVEIVITERTPVAVRRVGKQIHLVDGTGLDYAVARTAPPGVPVLVMADVRPGNLATRAAVTVLGAIPDQLKAKVVTVTAATPGDVRLKLADGRLVKWGNARDNARKAAVLAPLLTRPGKTYDVATPDFPTVAG